MPLDASKARDQYLRYVYLRDNGHLDFVEKANRCDAFYLNRQWRPADKNALERVGRPALTINKFTGTIDTISGEQINSRVDFAFKPRRINGGDDLSRTWELVFKSILDANQYAWRESEMAEDGYITSRGYLDTRLNFTHNIYGEIEVTRKNPRNILPDIDAEDYDPETWNDYVETRWLSPLDIKALWGKEEEADYLANSDVDTYSFEYDAVVRQFETFRARTGTYHDETDINREVRRNIRVLDRQVRELTRRKFFVDLMTGEMREIPDGWDREKIGFVMKKYQLGVTENLVKRVRWVTTAGPCVLFDDWSPYRCFTIVPYFPRFRNGKTSGVGEYLLDPQELLNKTLSQELHVVNTTANSGWKVKTGGLRNMDTQELEQRGAQTGIVLELDDINSAEKIEPNQVPTGLDRLSFKAEEHIKGISTVNDSTVGDDREDVAAKAIRAKRQSNVLPRVKIHDNLNRSRYFLARNIMWIVQDHYPEQRVFRCLTDPATDTYEDITINEWSEAAGRTLNDVSSGEYDITITVVPNKDTAMESEFEQGLALRELGLPIDDVFLIKNSNLKSKQEIIRDMQNKAQSPEAQAQAQAQQKLLQLEVEKGEADVDNTQADTTLKLSNAKRNAIEAGQDTGLGMQENPGLEAAKMDHESRENELDRNLRREEMAHERNQTAVEQQHDMNTRAVDQQHENEARAQDQQHEAGMARLGHAQSVIESNTNHEHSLAAEKQKAKLAPKPTPKTKSK